MPFKKVSMYIENGIRSRIAGIKKASMLDRLLKVEPLDRSSWRINVPDIGYVTISVFNAYRDQLTVDTFNIKLLHDWLKSADTAEGACDLHFGIRQDKLNRVISDAIMENTELYNDIMKYAYSYIAQLDNAKTRLVPSVKRIKCFISTLINEGVAEDSKIITNLRLIAANCSSQTSNISNIKRFFNGTDLIDGMRRHHGIISNVVSSVDDAVNVKHGIAILAKTSSDAVPYWCSVLARAVVEKQNENIK